MLGVGARPGGAAEVTSRQQQIERWRAQEVKEAAALVVEDRGLQKLLAAWPMVTIQAPACAALADDWPALWQAVQPDMEQLAALAGLQRGPAMVLYQRARDLRLIYPDGSVHAVARMVLQKRIKDALTKGAR